MTRELAFYCCMGLLGGAAWGIGALLKKAWLEAAGRERKR